MQESMHEKVYTANAIHPAALRTNATVTGPSFRRDRGESLELVVSAGAYTDGTHTVTLEEAPDDGAGAAGTFAAVGTGDFKGTAVVSAAGNANKTQRIAYLGNKPWVRAILVTSGATTGAFVDAVFVVGALRESSLSGQA